MTSPGGGSKRAGAWSSVGRAAGAKMVVMVLTGLFGLINTRLIIGHFGADAYAQYGLLASFPTLMPFTDLGIGAVILNTVAGSADPSRDSAVRRTVTTAIRALLASALIISTVAVVIGLMGLWPALLGAKLMEGGGATATICLIIYAMALPLSVGQRIVIGLGRSATQVISQGLVSPAMSCMLLAVIVARLEAGNAVSVLSYAANTLVSIVCVVVAWRITSPMLRQAVRDVPRLRSVRGVPIRSTAGPQLLMSLAIPIAFQTDRLLLSHLGRSEALAQYNLASTLFNLLTQTVMVAGVAMWPMFARARARGQIESPFAPAAFFGGGGLLAGLCLAALTPWAARLLSDGEIRLPAILVLSFATYVAVEAAKQPLGMYMTDPRGLRFQVIPVLVLVPANFVISWSLIGPFGAAGPILGSVISVVLCQLLPFGWWVHRDVARRRREAADDEQQDGEGPAKPADPTDPADPADPVDSAGSAAEGGDGAAVRPDRAADAAQDAGRGDTDSVPRRPDPSRP
ncbi:oligosaccharide flippase family protein [Actinomyces slackii]|uniref:Polysaccharide biosynthesis protein n=1 Tax=Actinomyces slackii TaxID=52774 RepID=A0A3S4WFB9_9ACTO|nr:oligosaccharide flippase family protein [Actinomyces slackii]VEG73661.1 Polysaccharide biosynthesis protein [Actinomyces slackii]